MCLFVFLLFFSFGQSWKGYRTSFRFDLWAVSFPLLLALTGSDKKLGTRMATRSLLVKGWMFCHIVVCIFLSWWQSLSSFYVLLSQGQVKSHQWSHTKQNTSINFSQVHLYQLNNIDTFFFFFSPKCYFKCKKLNFLNDKKKTAHTPIV